jgi:hypothetical protein
MQNDKTINALTRSVKRNLQEQHGIEVPYSALRACLLLAQGEQPHAFASKKAAKPAVNMAMPSDALLQQLVDEAPNYFHPEYDFDGKKLEWLRRAGVVPPAEPGQFPSFPHTLYLAHDDIGCLERMSLDREGSVMLPEDWKFDRSASQLAKQQAKVPRIAKYGLPVYLADPKGFYDERFNLRLAKSYQGDCKDLGDDSGDTCELELFLTNPEWYRLVQAVLEHNPEFEADVAEWVGLHYRRMFSHQAFSVKAEWVARYLAMQEENAG